MNPGKFRRVAGDESAGTAPSVVSPSRSGAAGGRRYANGLTLIEILVTLLVVSIGLLGVAALHSTSLRNNYDALLRSHASALAADIADRMRSNRQEVVKNLGTSNYNIALGVTRAIDSSSSQADRDVAEWKMTLDDQLPDGDGSIAIDGTGIVTIVVQWGERGQAMSFTTQTEV